jgi:heme-degrading monooxygenase HmoA
LGGEQSRLAVAGRAPDIGGGRGVDRDRAGHSRIVRIPHLWRTSNMITVGMNYHVIEGKQADFEEKFAAVIEALRAAPGHTQSNLWKDVADGASSLITSEWSDEQAFSGFIQSQAFRDVTNWGKEQILSDRPKHKVYKN